jgi:hypothetical protein
MAIDSPGIFVLDIVAVIAASIFAILSAGSVSDV